MRREQTAHVMIGRVPPCYGQCWVHRASKNLDKKCGDNPKRARHKPSALPGG